MNNRISVKERGLIKGALRRVFSRSDLRRQAIELSVVQHIDPNRLRVKKWSICPMCKRYIPTYKMQVDHVLPVIGIHETLEAMSWDLLVDRLWCDPKNLLAICEEDHKEKTRQERKLRVKYKKELNMSEAKVIRGQLRQIVKEELSNVILAELKAEISREVTRELMAKLKALEDMIKEKLTVIDERSKDTMGYLVRQTTAPTKQSE